MQPIFCGIDAITDKYSKLFSHVTKTVLMNVRHDNAVDTHLRFACIRHFSQRKMKNNIGCNRGLQ